MAEKPSGPIGFAQKKEEEIVFNINPSFRKFLEQHMERGNKVDAFLYAINERVKKYAAEMLKLDKDRDSKMKEAEAVGDINKKKSTATNYEKAREAAAEKFQKDIAITVEQCTKETFKDYTKFVGTMTVMSAGLGAVGLAMGMAPTGIITGTAKGLAYGAVLGGVGGFVISNAINAKEGLSSAASKGYNGLSVGERKVFESIEKEGIIPVTPHTSSRSLLKSNLLFPKSEY